MHAAVVAICLVAVDLRQSVHGHAVRHLMVRVVGASTRPLTRCWHLRPLGQRGAFGNHATERLPADLRQPLDALGREAAARVRDQIEAMGLVDDHAEALLLACAKDLGWKGSRKALDFTANSPSSTITMKIDFTTDVVVCRPSDSALPFTRKPSLQATMPITSAMNGALMMPTWKWVTDTASCSRARKIAGPDRKSVV